MDDGKYTVVVRNGVANVYDSFGVELIGVGFKEFADLVVGSKGEKRAADYQRNILKVLSHCRWKHVPKIKEIKNRIPSVYVIGAPALGIVKVGRSEMTRTRMRHHARYVEGGLAILGVWECPDYDHMIWLESALHHHLGECKVRHNEQNEWFDWVSASSYFSKNFSVNIGGVYQWHTQ